MHTKAKINTYQYSLAEGPVMVIVAILYERGEYSESTHTTRDIPAAKAGRKDKATKSARMVMVAE